MKTTEIEVKLEELAVHPRAHFRELRKLLYSLAWRYATPQFPFELALSEAYWGYIHACRSYDESQGTAFSSWVYTKVQSRLRNYLRSRRREPLTFVEIKDYMLESPAPAPAPEWKELIKDLSWDAKQVIRLLLDTPAHLLGDQPLSRKDHINRVCDHLSYHLGWDRVYRDITLYEIRAFLKRNERVTA